MSDSQLGLIGFDIGELYEFHVPHDVLLFVHQKKQALKDARDYMG